MKNFLNTVSGSMGRLGHGVTAAGLTWILLFAPWAMAEEIDTALAQIAELNNLSQIDAASDRLESLVDRISDADSAQQFEFRLLLARNLGMRGRIDEAIEELNQLLEQPLQPLERLRTLSLAANLASVSRRHDSAFAFLREAMEVEPEVADSGHRSFLFSIAAEMLVLAGEHLQAEQFAYKAVDLADASGVPYKQCVARRSLATVYAESAEPERLMPLISQALESCRQSGNLLYTGSLTKMYARALSAINRHDEAAEQLAHARTSFVQAGFSVGLPSLNVAMAELEWQQGRTTHAVALAQAQLDALHERQLWDYLVRAYELLVADARQRGDFSAALALLQQRVEVGERQLERDRSQRLAYLEVAFELDAREQELALLREQARAAILEEQSESQQERIQQVVYAGGGIVLLVLITLLTFANVQRRRYQEMSRRDSLTELLNHTHFFGSAEKNLERCRESGQPFSLVLADIDHFKRINDIHGHLVGDQVLRRVAARLREVFHAPAVIGRIGGEEFAVAIPDCRIERAAILAENLRTRINQFRSNDFPQRLTVSFGIAEAHDDKQGLEELRKRADRALYEAKHGGRDQISLAPQPSSPAAADRPE